ncbi:MAG TPA: hypothetical protein PKU68_04080 [Bacillota bacterium]|nr:hypothetical protein [Bacillota bacterium]
MFPERGKVRCVAWEAGPYMESPRELSMASRLAAVCAEGAFWLGMVYAKHAGSF